jgi:hypothetical protein
LVHYIHSKWSWRREHGPVSAEQRSPRSRRAILAIEGVSAHAHLWRREAEKIDPIALVPSVTIPLDRRHRSKVDLPALTRLLSEKSENAVS